MKIRKIKMINRKKTTTDTVSVNRKRLINNDSPFAIKEACKASYKPDVLHEGGQRRSVQGLCDNERESLGRKESYGCKYCDKLCDARQKDAAHRRGYA